MTEPPIKIDLNQIKNPVKRLLAFMTLILFFVVIPCLAIGAWLMQQLNAIHPIRNWSIIGAFILGLVVMIGFKQLKVGRVK